MSATPQERTLAAEVRGVEEGHLARLAPDGKAFLVKSETNPTVDYRVRVTEVAGVVVFDCSCPYGQNGPHTVPCKHSSLAARRLEREGLLRWVAGRWEATPKAEELGGHTVTVVSRDEDPSCRSNFECRCSCGWSAGVATTDRRVAVREGDAHVASFAPVSADDVFGMLSSGR